MCARGRRYGSTGPNGAGKSTFTKLLTGDLDPQRGTVVRPAKLGVLRDAPHQPLVACRRPAVVTHAASRLRLDAS
jgi:ATPase subunit of ABC transporter with duplicated ATPase domains